MTYDKDIPDFALVPAKAPEERVLIPITQGAVYSPVQVTNIMEKPKTIIVLEEDILVPDTRPDLKEILDITGKIRLFTRELDCTAHTEDSVTVSGDVELQTLYVPEKNQICGRVISIANRISFREQWHTDVAPGASLFLDARIEKIECMVVNERKFRVKIAICLTARECRQQKIDIFEGITGEDIQTLRETVEITNVALRKKDILTIREDLEQKDSDSIVDTILKQEITVVENYKQAAAEKIVINGFIYVRLLYMSRMAGLSAELNTENEESNDLASERDCGTIRQLQERVEFTQFIPLSQHGQWSGCSVCFDGSDLRVKMTKDENNEDVLRLEGDIITWVELYRNTEKEIIIDGYHREKDFVCEFEETDCRTLACETAGETTLREIVSLESRGAETEQILGVFGEITKGDSHTEAGKIVTEGILLGKLLCKGKDEADSHGSPLFTVRHEIPFRCVTAAPQADGEEIIRHQIYLKDVWAEKINGKQAEINASIMVSAEMMRHNPFKILKNPAFEEVQGTAVSANRSMVVYIVREGDTIWTVAKKFKSTVDSISQVNQIETGKLVSGQKLLILR